MVGFECSCHCRSDGKRLDVIAATQHDRLAAEDYARVRRIGIETVRDGARWHRIERSPGRYDFSSLLPMVEAARDAGMQVIWDLCHYGWPDGLDVFQPEFVDRFAEFARAVARLIAAETDEPPWYAPINEISFWAWAGGDVAYINPCATGRGFELKSQLARACLAAVDALWSVDSRARIVHCDPAIHIAPGRPRDRAAAEGHRRAQFQAWDMIVGRLWPQLGGDERYLDVLGVNYYPNNQWVLDGPTVRRGDPRYRPFREILGEIWERYGRPMIVAETGAQDEARPGWLRYVAEEVRAARREGIPVHGICLYPILDYPGWDDDRHCRSGLWGYPGPAGEREVHLPLVAELARQIELSRREPEIPGSRDQAPANPREQGEPGEEETGRAAF
ncbi:MAG TPA: beta-glucosidase [Thermoanaerobaculia bacterium]|jgi:beta-glucosidase/6-phospho-beta-glucosidase/beta-galactosidase